MFFLQISYNYTLNIINFHLHSIDLAIFNFELKMNADTFTSFLYMNMYNVCFNEYRTY